MSALLTTEEVAELAGVAAPSVRSKMRRAGVQPAARATGRAGASLWDNEQVRAALAAAQGRWPETAESSHGSELD